MRTFGALLAVVACVACETADEPVTPVQCLGRVELCGRAYDEVSYATSHNAMSNEAEGWFVPNHEVPLHTQLELGVRALMLDIHISEGELMLCHGTCLAGSEPLGPRLEALRGFLEANPSELLTVILESYAPAPQVAQAFSVAGLEALAHTQPSDQPWPTLGDLLENNSRLVVFTDDAQGGPAWMHNVWDHAFETSFAVKSADQLSCEPNRGEVGNALFILNHFLSTPFADRSGAAEINPAPFVLNRALSCWETHGQRPNFITVDFVAVGDVMGAVLDLNQRESPTDRTERQARSR